MTVLGLVVVTFVIPIIFTRSRKTVEVSKVENANDICYENTIKENDKIIENNYDYGKYASIKLLHADNNQIEEIKIDEYLYGVVSAEMPVDFEVEALKAQAVVARTYTLFKIANNKAKHVDADICDSAACCQAWISKDKRLEKWEANVASTNWEKIVNAVNATCGKIITYNREPINAFFHSNSGGMTEVPVNVWGGSGYPYLQVVETSGEDNYSQYSSEVCLTKIEFVNKIKEKHSNLEIDFSLDNCIEVSEKTSSGRVKTLKVGNLNLAGVEIRTILNLRSTNFEVNIDGENIKFSVIGYGHGVGMSQTGADALAKQGSSYEEIIKHFYVGVEIENM